MELVERIERATLAAVSPQQVQELPGWLLPMDSGTVGRAHAAVPLHHALPVPGLLQDIAARYRQAGYKPVLRLPDIPQWQSTLAGLQAQGWQRGKPTCVMAVPVAALCASATALLPAAVQVSLCDQASPEWLALFTGPGLDPVDGASRAQALARSQATRFAQATWDAQTVACGATCFSHGLLSAHGLRTALDFRGRGLATALLGAMAREAQVQGLDQAFLQVEATNPARRLYERLGFALAWQYEYWQAAQ